MTNDLIKDIIQWDTTNWGKLLPIWDDELKNRTGKAIAFGEREGGLSLYLAKKGFDVTCSDFNDFPSELPLEIHKKHKVDGEITYSKEDITKISSEDNSFDVVVFKSVIGALGDFNQQAEALKEIHRILKPGGVLLFAENTKSSKLHQFARKKFTNWGHRWYYPSLSEFNKMNFPFNSFEFKTVGFLGTFGRSEKQRIILGKIDSVIERMVPKSWRYILIGKSIK